MVNCKGKLILENKWTLVAAGLAAILAFVPVIGSAQSLDPEIKDDESRVVGICMSNDQKGNTLQIIVPQRDVKGMRGKGFKVSPCANGRAKDAELIAWRDKICAMASTMPNAIQSQFEHRYGERPSVLCGMAEQVTGQWKRKKEVAR